MIKDVHINNPTPFLKRMEFPAKTELSRWAFVEIRHFGDAVANWGSPSHVLAITSFIVNYLGLTELIPFTVQLCEIIA